MIGFIMGILAGLFGLVMGAAGALFGALMGVAGALAGLAIPILPFLLLLTVVWLLVRETATGR